MLLKFKSCQSRTIHYCIVGRLSSHIYRQQELNTSPSCVNRTMHIVHLLSWTMVFLFPLYLFGCTDNSPFIVFASRSLPFLRYIYLCSLLCDVHVSLPSSGLSDYLPQLRSPPTHPLSQQIQAPATMCHTHLSVYQCGHLAAETSEFAPCPAFPECGKFHLGSGYRFSGLPCGNCYSGCNPELTDSRVSFLNTVSLAEIEGNLTHALEAAPPPLSPSPPNPIPVQEVSVDQTPLPVPYDTHGNTEDLLGFPEEVEQYIEDVMVEDPSSPSPASTVVSSPPQSEHDDGDGDEGVSEWEGSVSGEGEETDMSDDGDDGESGDEKKGEKDDGDSEGSRCGEGESKSDDEEDEENETET